MRICMLLYNFYEVDNRVRRYAETLARRGDEVDVISLRRGSSPDFERIQGVNVYRIQNRIHDEKSKFDYLTRLIRFLLKSALILSKQYFRRRYQLIHVHSVPDFEVFAAFLPKMHGAKIILDIHDIVPEFYASKFGSPKTGFVFKALTMIEKLSIGFSDHTIISNHIWRDRLLSRSVTEEKCTVVLNWPDENIFFRRERTRKDGKFVILYPGSIGWHQGLDIAIRALALIKDSVPEAELHIYGSGDQKTSLVDLVGQLGLEQHVLFRPSVPADQIADLIANADLGIVPKRNDPFGGEAFSTKILEFMYLGVPVVVSRTRIDSFYFDESVVAFFTPDDEHDLARCLVRLIQDRSLGEELVRKATSFVANFTWEKNKGSYLRIVDALGRPQIQQREMGK